MKKLGGLVLAGMVAACGGGGGGGIDELCGEDGIYPDYFERIADCNPLFELIVGEGLDRSTTSAACYGALQPYLDDGTTTMGSDLDACADFVANATCDEFQGRGVDNPCEDLFEGTVPLGGLCETDMQCAGDAYCDQPSADTCGSCTALKANTAACVDDGECLSGHCDTTTVQCADFVAAGGDCDTDNDCEGVLVCNDTTLQCAEEPTWAVGSPCADFGDCGFGETDLYCSGASMQCAAYKEIGESCGASDGGSLCRLFEYQSCQETSAGSGVFECVAATIVGEGEQCSITDGTRCDTGLRCADHDGDGNTPDQCMVPLGEGDACNPDNNLCDLLMNCVEGMCQYGEYTGLCPPPPDAP